MKKFTDWQNDEWLKEKNKDEYREFVPIYRDQIKLLLQMVDHNEALPPYWSIIISILYNICQYGFTGQERDTPNEDDELAKFAMGVVELPEWAKVYYRLLKHTVRTSRTHAANKKRPKIETPQDNTTE